MLPKKLGLVLAALAGAVWLVSPARAQIGGSDLPDLSGLAGAIEQSVNAASPPPAPAKGKLYSSGLAVPSVQPGEAARGIGRQLREGVEKKTGPSPAMQKLEASMPTLLTGYEAFLVQHGFAKRDMGVAVGAFFVGNWETATGQSLSDPAQAAAVRLVSENAVKKWKHYDTLAPAAREKTYESLIVSMLLTTVLTHAFEKAGKTQEAQGMRQGAAAAFQIMVGVAPSTVVIGPDGGISSATPPAGTAAPSDTPGETPPVYVPYTPTAPTIPPPTAPPVDKPAGTVRAVAPRGGVRPSQIAGIYAELVPRQGFGGFMMQVYVPIIALKDGAYCEDFDVPPSDLDVAASRSAHPSSWGRWRRSPKGFQYQYNGAWEDILWIGPLSGSGPLSGTFSATGGSGDTVMGGEYSSLTQDRITFFPDGRFQSGSRSSFSVGNAPYVHKQETHGTYRLSTYAITLRDSTGQVYRWSYARSADGALFLHGECYAREKGGAAEAAVP